MNGILVTDNWLMTIHLCKLNAMYVLYVFVKIETSTKSVCVWNKTIHNVWEVSHSFMHVIVLEFRADLNNISPTCAYWEPHKVENYLRFYAHSNRERERNIEFGFWVVKRNIIPIDERKGNPCVYKVINILQPFEGINDKRKYIMK